MEYLNSIRSWSSNFDSPTQEAIKEFFRVQISGIPSVMITFLLFVISGINQQTGVISINWLILRAIILVQVLTLLVTAITKASDKLKHEEGKEKGYEGKPKPKGWIPM